MNYIIANWKMKMLSRDMLDWFDDWHELKKDLSKYPVEVIVAPTNIHIPLLASLTKETVKISSQDISQNDKGAHTGDTGGFQIKEFCQYSIVGHSERKEDFETVIAKRDKCLEHKITPIVCFTNPQDAQKYYKDGIILAWEDPNNISVDGKYRDKDPEEIKKGVEEILSSLPENSTLIYGGSVNRENVKDLVQIDKLAGALVGNASLDPKHFLDIVRAYAFRKPPK